jgi:hypothetical protein
MLLERRCAGKMGVPLDIHARRLDDFERWLHNFRTDAIARYQCNFVFHRTILSFALSFTNLGSGLIRSRPVSGKRKDFSRSLF